MRLDRLEPAGSVNLEGPLQRCDARVKIVATLVYVLAVVGTPIGAWRLLAAEALLLTFVVGLSGVAPRVLLTRWLGFLVFFGFLTLMVAPSRPERLSQGLAAVAFSLLVKDSLTLIATLLLVEVTRFPVLLIGLRGIGVPVLLVASLQFMYRYLFVFVDELARMVQARRARTFRRSGRLDWGLLTGLIGVLFVRSYERGERVHSAMLARGWDGTVRTLD
ncbi:MAG: CbiQ family ECF transporter T component [Isosphaeraceae bacterium]